MRVLLLTCLLASAFAAPAQRIKKDILPGDPRYDAKHDHKQDKHEHHENEVEISKALDSSKGPFSVPEISFGSVGLETGSSTGSTDILEHDSHKSKAASVSDAVKVADSEVSNDLKSDIENSFTTPQDKSVTVVKPTDSATSTNFFNLASRTTDFGAIEESFKNSDETKVETESASDKTSSDTSKTAIESSSIDAKSSAKAFSSNFGPAADSLAAPVFGSSFDSGFPSLGQSEYNPSFYSAGGHNTPGFDGFNTNFDFYNSNGGLPSNLGTYSGFDQISRGHNIGSNIPVHFAQSNPIDFTANVPYNSPSSFTSFTSETGANPAQFKFSNTESYLSPQVGSEYQHLFKSNNPFPLVQPTSASFQSQFQPEGSYSGFSQLTANNGGYVY